jgi:hypothetical protein
MTSPPPIPPIDSALALFRGFFNWLMMDLSASLAWAARPPQAPTMPMFVEISRRIQRHQRRIQEIAARVQAGTYVPRRRSAEPPAPAAPAADPAAATAPAAATDAPPKTLRKPPPPSVLPNKRGWLMPMIPTQATARRGRFDALLRDPGMVALMQAAPVPLSRPIRALCWAFGLKPPAILPPPRRRPRPPKPPRAKKEKPPLPAPYKPPPHPEAALPWMREPMPSNPQLQNPQKYWGKSRRTRKRMA